MSMSFRSLKTEEIEQFILARQKEIGNLLRALAELRDLEKKTISVANSISFTVTPDFDKIFTSIHAFLGIFTEEISNAKAELRERPEYKSAERGFF